MSKCGGMGHLLQGGKNLERIGGLRMENFSVDAQPNDTLSCQWILGTVVTLYERICSGVGGRSKLLKMTIKQDPTSANTAAQTKGWPDMATARIAALIVIETMTFSMIFLRTLLASLMAFGILPRSLDVRITWPVSMARAEPETPIDSPTSAVANAGASFKPSPVMAVAPSFLNSLISFALSSGSSSAWNASKAPPN
nr:NAD-dependent DNA ligase [Ipomoea batatas]